MRRQRAGYPFDNQVLAKQRLIGMVHAKDSGVAERRCAYSMLMRTKDFVDVAARARALGCRVPVRVALLPGNFATAANAGEFCYHAATPHVRSAWKSVGFEDEGPGSESGIRDLGLGASSGIRTPIPSPQHLDPSQTGPQSLAPSASEKVPLAVFFGAGLQTGPEWCLTVALGMVSRVLALDPRCASPRAVRLDVVVQRPGGGFACLEYHGDAYGLVALAREVRGIWEVGEGSESGDEVALPRLSGKTAGRESQTAIDNPQVAIYSNLLTRNNECG
jgi:hypothetical protein